MPLWLIRVCLTRKAPVVFSNKTMGSVRLSCMWVCVTVLMFKVGNWFLKLGLVERIALSQKEGPMIMLDLLILVWFYVPVWSFA